MQSRNYRTDFIIASDDIVSEDFGSEAVVLDLRCGRYFSMNEPGSAIWKAIAAGVSVEAMCTSVVGASTVTAESIRTFVDQLIGHGCLAATDGAPSTDLSEATRETLLRSTELPAVEVFDDLADLILADPIHDVEESQGWPVLKQMAAE